ncbi:MAG: hypothetical protein IJU92_09915 [Spirochaetaceae bacterium]|nr:hypothetical protein [Spirochaetaceae bacterium]
MTRMQIGIKQIVKPIALVGMPCVGKSFIGKHLALHYKIPFYDSDNLILQKYKQSSAELFKTSGEQAFRKAEARVIAETFQTQQVCILATGGGSLESKEVQTILKNAIVVYLKADLSVILKRHRKRAQLRGSFPEYFGCGSCENFLEEYCETCAYSILERLEQKRSPLYETACSLTILSSQPIDNVINAITQALETV